MIQNSDNLRSIPTSSTLLRSRTTSLLPIPARRDTSLSPLLKSPTNSSLLDQRASPSRPRGISTTQRPSLTTISYSANSIRNPTKIRGRQPSSPSTLTLRNPPTQSLRSFPSSASLGKPAGAALATLKKPADKAIDDQTKHFRSLAKSFSHVPRKPPSASTANNTPTGKPHPFPAALATPLRLQRPGGLRNVTSRALSPAPSAQPVQQPGAITFQKTRTITSHPEMVQEPSATPINTAGQVSRAIQKFSLPLDPVNASPESIQSKITLTDGGSSIQMKLEYPHHRSVTSSPSLLSSKVPSTVPESNNSRWSAGIDKSPQITLLSKLTRRQECPQPQEFQSRAYTLEKLQSFIGTHELQRLINPDALYQLISRSDLYETQQDIQERVSKESVHQALDGQNPHARVATPLASQHPPTCTLPPVPCATLKATAPPLQPPAPQPSPHTLPTEAASAGPDSGQKKSYVGNILLEKLGWKSRSTTRSPRPVTPKATGKSRRPSSFILNSSAIKSKLPGQQASSGKYPPSEQRRFSQILGAKLEIMNCSVCVVLMGERYHVLPIICFNVIEEIYRRGKLKSCTASLRQEKSSSIILISSYCGRNASTWHYAYLGRPRSD